MDSLINFSEKLTSWRVIQHNNNGQAFRICSPFNFAEDGTLISFSVFLLADDEFFLCDHANHFLLAESLGAHMDARKLSTFNRDYGVRFAQFDENGEIYAEGKQEYLQDALFDAAKLALALSFNYKKWLPVLRQQRFNALIESKLYERIDREKIKKNYWVQGISGRKFRIPFAVWNRESKYTFISPLPVNDAGLVLWEGAYKLGGRLNDLKANRDLNKRLVVIPSEIDKKHQAEVENYFATLGSVSDINHIYPALMV